MTPIFKTLPAFKVIGFPSIVSNPPVEIPPLWQLMEKYREQIPNKSQPAQCIGLEFYPMDFNESGKFSYMPCYMVDTLDTIPDIMCGKTIPAAHYAVFTHRGGVQDIHKTFMYIYKEWLPSSGYKMSHPFDFEWYDHRFKGPAADSELEIYLPVELK